MTRFDRQALYIAVAFAVCCASASTPAVADGRPIDALGRLVGTWKSTATFVNPDHSKDGPVHADATCAWSSSREFVICQQAVVYNGQVSHNIAVYSYDPVGKRYIFHKVELAKSTDSAIDVTPTTIIYSSSFKANGKTMTIRTVNNWISPVLYDFLTDFSLDGGKHWTTMLRGSAHRVASK